MKEPTLKYLDSTVGPRFSTKEFTRFVEWFNGSTNPQLSFDHFYLDHVKSFNGPIRLC